MNSAELSGRVKKNPLLVACSVLTVGLVAGIYFRSGSIPEANAILDEKTGQAQKYALNINHSAQLKEQLDALTAANAAMQARLISPSELGTNQQFFFKLEGDTGVKLTELNQSTRDTGAKNGKLMPVTFFVTAQGDFNQVVAFLRAIENGTPFCRVVSGSCNGNRTGRVSLSLTVELLGRP